MKSIFKKLKFSALTFLPLFVLMFFISCQDEESIVVNPQPEETIDVTSNLANLMSRTSSFDGRLDDLLDAASCLGINLPVTITVNNITITISTLNDLQLLEDIINEFNTDDDILEFLFPITITLNDYTTVVINDEDELDVFVEECTNTEHDEVIECVDFVYPISFSIYDANFQIIETVVIQNDQGLFEFIDFLENNPNGGIFASLNFPVTMVYANGETIEVNNNQELEDAINAAENDCEVTDECTEVDVDLILMECAWNIVSYNTTDVYLRYDIYFNENQNLRWYDGDTTVAIGGNWITSMSDEGIVVTISNMTAFQDDINGEWLVVSCENDRFELINGQDTMILEQNCDTDFDCRNIQAYIGDTCQTATGVSGTINADCECEENTTTLECSDLEECYWYAETNLYDTFVAEQFYFGPNNVVEIVNAETNQIEDTGNYWLNVLPDGTQILTFSFQQVPHDLISLEWEIIACEAGVIELVNGYDTLTLSQECSNCDNPMTLTNGLIIYMPFGNEVKDLISGDIVNDFTFLTEDRDGNATCAVEFNGNENFSIPVTTQNQLVQGDSFTISIWFKMQNTEAGDLEIFFRAPGNATQGFNLGVYDLNSPLFFDNLNFSLWDNDWNQEVDVTWTNTDWHHLVATVDSNNTVKLYRDGVLRNIVENSNFSVGSQPANMYILGEGFVGHLDDLRVYRRALSSNEIGDLFNLAADCYTCL